MLKDMQIANQIGLSHYLDLGVTVAARDQLLEQMQWGHGDDDFSVVARKYLQEPELAVQEELQMEEREDRGGTSEPITGAAELEIQNSESHDEGVAGSPRPVLNVGAANSGAANQETRLRRGLQSGRVATRGS